MKNLWQIATLVCIVIILYLAMCNRPAKVDNDLEKQNKELVKKVKQDSIDRASDSIAFVKLKNEAHANTERVRDSLNRTEILLYQSAGTINRLVAKLNASKELPFDSSFVYVAPSYVDACDSLGIVSTEQVKQIEQAKKETEQAFDLLNYEVHIRDSALMEESKRLNELRNDFNAQTHFFNLAVKAGKKRVKGYAGVSALGNNVTPFGGGEASFSLQLKNDQQYELGAGFINKDWYIRFGTKFKISFK